MTAPAEGRLDHPTMEAAFDNYSKQSPRPSLGVRDKAKKMKVSNHVVPGQKGEQVGTEHQGALSSWS